MHLKVKKRDGSLVSFNKDKINTAICSAYLNLKPESDNKDAKYILKIVESICRKITVCFEGEVDIEDIQEIVVHELMKSRLKDVAEQYIKYRQVRTERRNNQLDVETQVKRVFDQTDNAVVNENANKDSKQFAVQRDYTAGQIAKTIALKEILPEDVANAHLKGDIHYHDLQYSPFAPLTNCCLIDFKTMLNNGYQLGNAKIDSPKSIQTATAQMTQIIANVASSQYGGCSSDRTDEVLAPFAKINYNKHLEVISRYINDSKQQKQFAKERTKKDIYDAMQALEYEINTLFSSQGQTPFVTIGFGLGTNWIERAIQESILKVRLEGLGVDKRTAIFPKLVFTLKDGTNLKPDDPNYDIKQLALECCSKRIYPDVLSYDKIKEITGSFKAPMGCVRGKSLITYSQHNKIYTTTFEKMWEHFKDQAKLQPNGIDQYVDLKDVKIKDSHTGKVEFVDCLRIIKNTTPHKWLELKINAGKLLQCTEDHPLEVVGKGRVLAKNLRVGDRVISSLPFDIEEENDLSTEEITDITPLKINEACFDVTTETDFFDFDGIVSRNCRSFLQGWEDKDGNEVNSGRMNLGVVTVNLPRIALEAHHDLDQFWKIFFERMSICKKALLTRFKSVCSAKPENAPILYKNGAFGHYLKDSDDVKQLFLDKRATISLGYIGLYETAAAFFGGNWEHNNNAKSFTIEILRLMKELCLKWSDEYNIWFSLYSTPAESLTDRFCKLDKEKFGVIKDITDKDYYMNSFHLDDRKAWTPFEKIDFEKPYPYFASGGFIHYVEAPSLSKNLKALEAIWDYAYQNIGYFGVNSPIDQCYKCGYKGEFEATARGFKCPECGNHDPKTCDVVKRLCGYLGNPQARPMVNGRHKEIVSRVKHVSTREKVPEI